MLRSIRLYLYLTTIAGLLVFGGSTFALSLIDRTNLIGQLAETSGAIVLSFLLTLPIIQLMCAALARSFGKVNAALARTRQGQFTHLDETTVPAELAPVVSSYNRMSAALEARERELREELRHTALLTRLSLELRESLDVQVIVDDVLRVIATNTDANQASIMLLGPDGAIGITSRIADGRTGAIPADRARGVLERGLAGWVLRHSRSVVLADATRDNRWLQLEDHPPARSVIAIPLTYNRATLGVLTITHPDCEHFTSRDLLLLEGVAAQAGVAISAAQRYAEEQQRREQALLLFSISQFLTSKRSAVDLATELLEKSAAVFDARCSGLFLVDQHSGTLACFATRSGPLRGDQDLAGRLTGPMAVAAAAAWHDQKTAIDIIGSGAGFAIPGAQIADIACVALPLLHNGAAIGAFVLASPAHGTAVFSARIWTLLTLFTNVAAAAFVNLQLIDQLHERASVLEREVELRTQQLKRSRDLLRIVFDHLPDGLVLLSADARVLAANEMFCQQVLGLHPTQVVGRNYPALTQALRALEPQSAGPASRRTVYADTPGRQRWYEIEHFVIASDNSAEQQTIERWRDVTQQEQLRSKLLFHEELTSIGQLAASVVHGIGNPLQSVRSCLDLCREDPTLSIGAAEYLALADGELERINDLLDRLRRLYRASETSEADQTAAAIGAPWSEEDHVKSNHFDR